MLTRLAYSITMLRCPSTISNIFASETAWPIKVKLHVQPPMGRGTKVNINGPGHMTNMAASPYICMVRTFEIFFFRARSPMILKFCMQHQKLKLYKLYINDNHGLTSTYVTARSNWDAYTLYWGKTVSNSFE